MRAIGYRTPGDIDAAESLVDIDIPRPQPGPRDLLVEVRAVSVNRSTRRCVAGQRPTPTVGRCLAGTPWEW